MSVCSVLAVGLLWFNFEGVVVIVVMMDVVVVVVVNVVMAVIKRFFCSTVFCSGEVVYVVE